MLIKTPRTGALAFLSDIHFPYEDTRALEAAEDVLRDVRPSTIIVGGDAADFEEVSFYEKNPYRTAPLQEEIDRLRAWLVRLREAHRSADIVFLAGNHEDRLRKWLVKHGLATMRCLEVPELLGLADLRMRFVPYDKGYQVENVLFRHGQTTGISAGRKNLQAAMMSGVSGHTHKVSYDAITTATGALVEWVQAGCLCGAMPYWQSTPQQQQGMALGWRVGGLYRLRPVSIIDGDAML